MTSASRLAGLLVLLAFANSFPLILIASGLVGIGSSVFHPEASRVARLASGGKHGFAQSLFQVGGNVGSSFGPLLGAFLVAPRGQPAIAWCSLLALVAMGVLWKVGNWYRARRSAPAVTRQGAKTVARVPPLITAAVTVTPCPGSCRSSMAMIWRASSRTALTPFPGSSPACADTP